MISLIINIFLLVALAAFVALNVPFTTDVNLFGYVAEGISTVAVILLSVVFGILFSFFFYLAEGMRKARKQRQKQRLKEIKVKEKQIGSAPALEAPANEEKKEKRKGPRLFDRIRKKGNNRP
jgi:uncharacterized integral membrane protein